MICGESRGREKGNGDEENSDARRRACERASVHSAVGENGHEATGSDDEKESGSEGIERGDSGVAIALNVLSSCSIFGQLPRTSDCICFLPVGHSKRRQRRLQKLPPRTG